MSKIEINNVNCEIHATNNNGDIHLQVKGDDVDQLILITIMIANVARISNIPFGHQLISINQIYNDLDKYGITKGLKENDGARE